MSNTIETRNSTDKICPRCKEASAVRQKLLLIDEAWSDQDGQDPRLAYFSSLRADDVKTELGRSPPLEQFVDGYFCDRCGIGFVPDNLIVENPRHYWR
jgi:hypothetical protein